MRRPAVVRCKGCGKPERRDASGYTDIAPFLGYCVDCINRVVVAVRAEEEDQ